MPCLACSFKTLPVPFLARQQQHMSASATQRVVLLFTSHWRIDLGFGHRPGCLYILMLHCNLSASFLQLLHLLAAMGRDLVLAYTFDEQQAMEASGRTAPRVQAADVSGNAQHLPLINPPKDGPVDIKVRPT